MEITYSCALRSVIHCGMTMHLDQILPKIERFLRRFDVSPTVFGTKAAKDPNLVPDLRDGRELRRATRERIAAYMADFKAVQK